MEQAAVAYIFTVARQPMTEYRKNQYYITLFENLKDTGLRV